MQLESLVSARAHNLFESLNIARDTTSDERFTICITY